MNFRHSHCLALSILVMTISAAVYAGKRGEPLAVAIRPYGIFLAPAKLPIHAGLTQSDLYPFDGEWEGEMRTTFSSGPCGMLYRLTMSVAQGAATGSAARAGESFTLFGKISADGKLAWSVTGGRGGASGEGVVEGAVARGDWEDDTGHCAGTFSIEKSN